MTWPWIAVISALGVLSAAQALALTGVITPLLAHLEELMSQPAALHPLPGTPLSDVTLLQPSGGQAQSRGPAVGARVLLFAGAFCPSCVRLLTDLKGHSAPPALPVILNTSPESLELLDAGSMPAWLTIQLEENDALSDALRVNKTPLAAVVSADHRVRVTETPTTAQQLLDLATPLPAQNTGSLTTRIHA